MKHYSFYRLFLSVLLLAIFGTLDISAQQRPSGPPVPKIMQLKDLGQRGDETDTYLNKVFWGLRDATHEETQALANQLTARMKWADKMIEEMDNGTRPMDKAWYDELIQEGKCWLTFYIKIGESFSQQFCFLKIQHNDKWQWYFEDPFPTFRYGSFIADVPESQVGVNGHTLENKGGIVSLNDGKKPYRCGYIQSYPNAPSELIPIIISGERLEVAKRDYNLAWNMAILFADFPVPYYRDNDPSRDRFDIYQQKIFFYLQAFDEAFANNTPDKLEFKPMPKAGGLNASMKSKVLAIEKSIAKEVVDVVITSDSWQVERNASGQPIRRVIFGYSIVQTEHGKMATRVSWAEDHQGGGKYGGLRAYGNGMESYYVK